MSTDSPGTTPGSPADPAVQPAPASVQPPAGTSPVTASSTAAPTASSGTQAVVTPAGAATAPASLAQFAPTHNVKDALGTGRRKTSVARVRLRPGSGRITINSREFTEYFPNLQDQLQVLAPLERTEQSGKVDVIIRVKGGGPSGQSGACKLGIARALKVYNPLLEPLLREANLLTRDGRMKERKKYGLRGARRGTQFSKR